MLSMNTYSYNKQTARSHAKPALNVGRPRFAASSTHAPQPMVSAPSIRFGGFFDRFRNDEKTIFLNSLMEVEKEARPRDIEPCKQLLREIIDNDDSFLVLDLLVQNGWKVKLVNSVIDEDRHNLIAQAKESGTSLRDLDPNAEDKYKVEPNKKVITVAANFRTPERKEFTGWDGNNRVFEFYYDQEPNVNLKRELYSALTDAIDFSLVPKKRNQRFSEDPLFAEILRAEWENMNPLDRPAYSQLNPVQIFREETINILTGSRSKNPHREDIRHKMMAAFTGDMTYLDRLHNRDFFEERRAQRGSREFKRRLDEKL